MVRTILVVSTVMFGAMVSGTVSADEQQKAPGNHYIRVGAFTGFYRDTSFKDEDCDSRGAQPLFGCGRDTHGNARQAFVGFDSTVGGQLGYGYRIASWLRIEGNFDYQRGLDISGNSNFNYASRDNQKFSSKLEVASLTVWGLAETPSIESPLGRKFNLYGGFGVGAGRLSLKDTKIDFPRTYTAVPDGEVFNPVFGLTAGLSHQVSDTMALDVGWRYMDYGRIKTDTGRGGVVFRNGNPTIPLNLSPIEADLRGNEIILSLRIHL